MNSEPCSFWVLLLAARLLNVMAALQAVTVFMDGCCVPEVVLIGRAGWFTQWYISPGFQNSFLIRTRWEERGELTGGAICEECISHQTRLTLCSWRVFLLSVAFPHIPPHNQIELNEKMKKSNFMPDLSSHMLDSGFHRLPLLWLIATVLFWSYSGHSLSSPFWKAYL